MDTTYNFTPIQEFTQADYDDYPGENFWDGSKPLLTYANRGSFTVTIVYSSCSQLVEFYSQESSLKLHFSKQLNQPQSRAEMETLVSQLLTQPNTLTDWSDYIISFFS